MERAYQTKHVRGRHVRDVDILRFKRVQYHHGLVQDVPLELALYDRVDKDALARLHLAYIEPDEVPNAPFSRVIVDDAGTTPEYDAWWAL